MCDNCTSRKELCIYGSRVACLICQQRKARCSFLDARHKHKNDEVDSEEEKEPTPKKPRSGVSKPSGSIPTVEISGSTLAANRSPVIEMVGLLRELVEGVRDLTKVTWGLAGLGTQIYQQNAKLVWLGERQSYLAEQARKEGSGSGSETEKEDSENEGARKDKGKGKPIGGNDETMKSVGSSGSDEEEDRDSGVGVFWNPSRLWCYC
jgi:hypothetical protein